MIALSCLCGQVRLEAARRPDFIHACNCALCSKSGAHWGYFHPSEVTVDGGTRGYRRTDKAEPAAEVHSCTTCGATTHFVLTPDAIARYGNSQIGVNMLLAEENDLAGVELRFPDGRSWSGGSDFGYVRAPRTIGAAE